MSEPKAYIDLHELKALAVKAEECKEGLDSFIQYLNGKIKVEELTQQEEKENENID